MKPVYIIFLLLFFAACRQKGTSKVETGKPATQHKADTGTIDTGKTIPEEAIAPVAYNRYEKELLDMSSTILKFLKEKNYTGLSEFVHPQSGTRFSLYAYADTLHDQVLSGKQLVSLGKSQRKINWGTEDESGKPVLLSVDNYFKRFVYDADFLNAGKKSVNKFLGSGNSLNNLKEIYPGCDFTEFYFPGFDPKYEGMDWKTLRLVFKKYRDTFYLVGIIHDEWTI